MYAESLLIKIAAPISMDNTPRPVRPYTPRQKHDDGLTAQERYRKSGRKAAATKRRKAADPEGFLAYSRAHNRKHRAENLEKCREQDRIKRARYYRENPEKYIERNLNRLGWWSERKERFWVDQKGLCDICGCSMELTGPNAPNLNGRGAAVATCDHSHVTGHPRSLLCTNCNKGLGHFKDDPSRLEKAAAYIRRWGG